MRLEQASVIPFPCPNCGDTVAVRFKYHKLYLLICAIGALVFAYSRGWDGILFVGGFVMVDAVLLLTLGPMLSSLSPKRLEKASPYLQTLGIGPRKRG